jgi:serine/threonine protein kinase
MSQKASDSTIGTSVLGRYRVVRKLARGGMGAVYLARTEGAQGFARPVVIKRVLAALMDDDEIAQMFIREARILSNLQHPNIVQVLDFGQESDGAYVMVLDYVHGYHLGQWERFVQQGRGEVPLHFALHIVLRVLDALHYAHTLKRPDGKDLQVIHRDVTPSNVLLDLQGTVKLLDFGIARVSGDESEFLTERPKLKGKFPYLAPEIFKGQEPTVQSDVYSTAVVLFELLTGTNPFSGRETADIYHKVLTATVPSVHALRDEAPEPIDEVLQKALNKEPAERYQSAAEFADALNKLCERSDAVVVDELREQLRADFLGELPAKLRIEPLSVRDAAWRNPDSMPVKPVKGGPPLPPLPAGKAAPPPSPSLFDDDDEDEDGQSGDTADLTLGGAEGVTRTADVPVDLLDASRALRAGEPLDRPTFRPAGLKRVTRPEPIVEFHGLLDPVAPQTAATTSATAARSRRSLVGPLIAVALLLSAVSLGLTVLGRRNDAARREVVVIERQVDPAPAAAAALEPAAPAPSEPSAPPEQAGTPEPEAAEPPPRVAGTDKPGEARPAAPPDPRVLTRRFGRKQARVEACFQQHGKSLGNAPQLSIYFKVDVEGRVQQAGLQPENVAGTPLGACLLEIARGTQFGPQQREVSFRIPISAQLLGDEAG